MRPTPGMEWRTRGDDVIDLVAGQLAAFAGLCALRHLDLQLVGVDEVVGGDAEAAAGHLLDRAAAQIAVGVGLEAGFVFAAFAGVRHAAEAVHGDGEGFVRFFAEMDPKLMAPVVKRLTISLAGSTSSIGIGFSAYLSLSSPRSVQRLRF